MSIDTNHSAQVAYRSACEERPFSIGPESLLHSPPSFIRIKTVQAR